MKKKAYIRYYDCREYDECLDRAARAESLFDCRDCKRYVPLDANNRYPDDEMQSYYDLLFEVFRGGKRDYTFKIIKRKINGLKARKLGV